MRYSIGDTAWRATFDRSPREVACPDCGGEGRLRVTFHDETQVSIECRNCARGYDAPTGRVLIYDGGIGRAERVVISGVEADADGEKYRVSVGQHAYWSIPLAELFDDEVAALARAATLAAEHDEAERHRVFKKEKDTRTWAWNASYHRRCIEKAKKDITYHEAKLAVASVKAKEEKSTKQEK